MKRRDGTPFWIMASVRPIKYGGESAFISVFIDNTERKRAEDKLRLSEEKFAKAFATNPAAIAMTRLEDGLIIEVNDTWQAMFGYSRDEVVGGSTMSLQIWPTPKARARCAEELREKGSFRDWEQTLLTKSGEPFVSLASAELLIVAGEEVVLSTWLDITERKRMEEELRKSHDELELRVQERTGEVCRQAELLDLAHDAIIVRQLDGVITFWNKGAEEMYGWTKEEALGKTMRDLLQTQFPIPRDEIMAKLMQEGRWEEELIHTRKDGKKINVLARWVQQRDEEGRPTGVMLINTDITDRLKLEEHLRQTQKLESIGTLTGGIAHDFNNILGAIVINSEMALFDLPGGSGLRTNLDLILKSGLRGKDLVRQMLLFSRKSERSKR